MARNSKRTVPRTSLFPRQIPQMPDGYYSGDQPNPHLRAFVEAHLAAHPYDPATDDYAVPAFDQPIETTKATAIYNMHTYWSKKPHDAIRQYIAHYTQPGDLVLDPFCGSGGTALAALMEGRAAIAVDRSPAATFITKNYCTPVDVDVLQEAFEELKAKVKPEIDWLYATRCDRCDGAATTGYTVYSQVFQCPRCLSKVPLFDCAEVETATKDGKAKTIRACPVCQTNGIIEVIRSQSHKFGSVPVKVSYLCENGCKPARGERSHNDPNPKKREYFARYDLVKLAEIDAREIPHWYPRGYDMTGFSRYQRDALYYYGVKEVADLFTKRNLWALAAWLNGIRTHGGAYQDVFMFTFTSILLKASRMMAHNNDGIGRIQKGTYYLPQILHDIHVGQFMAEALGDMVAGYRRMNGIGHDLAISTSDARVLDMPTASVDYIFTDPPYADKVQYGELNFVWEAWLGFDTRWHVDEIIVNGIRGKTEDDWAAMMRQALGECNRVLKPGRSISLCYHDTSEGTWALLQDLMAEAGFLPEKTEAALYIDAKTKTTNQYFADKVTKRDLVINFRKPRPGEAREEAPLITGEEDERTFGEKARAIIRDYLTASPGATKDRVYDAVVSHMVRAGSMEAHDFDALLAQVAEEVREPVRKNLFENEAPNLFGTHEVGHWFLKDVAEAASVDAAETAKEDAAARKLTAWLIDYRKTHPHKEGAHYSDIFEWYLWYLRGLHQSEKPRRFLPDWLPDYCFKTDDGSWRGPVGEEEVAAKAQARSNGVTRRIKRYLAFLEQGVAVPAKERPSDATLAEWVRQCRRAGLYEQGTQLYEQGGLRLDHLSEEAQVEVEEDYQVCVRQLARAKSGGDGSAKAGSKRGKL